MHPKDVWGGGGGGGKGYQLTDVYGNYSSRINTPLDTNLFSIQTFDYKVVRLFKGAFSGGLLFLVSSCRVLKEPRINFI